MLSAEEQFHILQSGAAQIIPEDLLKKKLARGTSLNVKLGVDPTAPDIHIGHAVPLRKLRQFQDLGHHVTLIIGDGTALIGDPSGRNTTRPQLSREQVAQNAQTYVDQAFKILDREKTTLRYNSEWILDLNMESLLKLMANFTVARILERDDFTKRYKANQPISLHEFLYPVMQAYDSVVVKADVELGGTDQLFNLLAGRELMEKMGMEPQVCLTLPLLEGTDGVKKMSKSYGNYIGLTDEPADMFGKVMSIPDALMVSTTVWPPRHRWTKWTRSRRIWHRAKRTRTRRSVPLLATSWRRTTARKPHRRRNRRSTASSRSTRFPRTFPSMPRT